MADTTALKNRIRAAIKSNDNQEITGPVLQQALLDMVDELNGATETEASQRQNGDSTLQQGITQLQTAVRNLRNAGYAFGGIAIPGTNPGVPTSNCFYIAIEPGTYNHFKNADNESIILTDNGLYVLTYEAVENNYWEYDDFLQIKQQKGNSAQRVMSQKAVTDELEKIPYEQSETGTSSSGDFSQYNTTTIQIKDGDYFRVNTSFTELYIMWNDGSYTSITSGMLYQMEYPTGKTFSNLRVLTGDAGAEVTVKVEIMSSEYWKKVLESIDNKVEKNQVVQLLGISTTNIMSQKAVTDELEKIPHEQSETGMSSSDSNAQYNTTTIQIKDGDYFKVNTSFTELYIMWNDGSYTGITSGILYQMEYPAGKTYHNIRVLTHTPGVSTEVTVKVEIMSSKYWKEVLESIDNKVEKNQVVQLPGISTTNVMSQKAVTDCFNKKEAIENDDFHFENTSETDIHSQNLTYGKCISILVSELNGASTGTMNVYGATTPTGGWIPIGVVIIGSGSELVISLDRDYYFVRIGGGSVVSSLSGSYSIYDSYVANRTEQVGKIESIINERLLPDSEVVHRDLDFSVQISDGTSSGDIAVSADASKLRQGNNILVENLSGSGSIEVYAYRSDNTYYGYGSIAQGSNRTITLLENYVRIKAYSSQVHHVRMTLLKPGVISEAVKSLTANSEILNNKVSDLEEANLIYKEETGISSSGDFSQYNTTTIQIKDGERFKFESGYNENYIMWNDGSFTSISDGMTYVMEYPAGKTYRNLRVLTGQAEADVTVKVTFIPEVFEDTVKGINKANGGITLPVIKALILGDSYSAGGGNWVYPMLSKMPTGSSYISLAVSSASLKDHYADRETYPYTDRPVSTDNTGNHNTLACQIQKLKRLMAGTDLDAGESPIYQTPESYPNVIIIAGGKNDGYDSDDKVATYHAQLNKVVNNVYRKRYFSDENPELGSVTIKTPIEEVDRTCFAGAYRYLMDELLALFPNAHVYFATVSPISYRGGGDVSKNSLKITNQQRLCADIFGASLIDWYRDGQINSVANYAQGSGTEDDPYIWGQCTLPNADTHDQLHPNARGGRKYGICAAHAIINTFIEIV